MNDLDLASISFGGPVDRAEHEILVVDDNPVSRYATVRRLQSVGFRTQEAATGAEALEKAETGISAVVLDVHLPDIDGFAVCRVLRSRSHLARLPVVHLSAAHLKDDDKVRGLDSGADAYLTHPVEPAVLAATVQALVRTRMAEDALRRSEARFRTLYAQAPSGICLLDAEGRFVDANPALLKLLRRELLHVAGRRLSEFVPGDWMAQADEHLAQTGHAAWRTVLPLLDAEGRTLHVEWSVSAPLEPGLAIAVATDVSERVTLELQRREVLEREQAARSEAERLSRLKDDLIAVLSHELRAPLNAIMGWTHVLQKVGGSDQTMRGLAAIERNGKTQARLISDILDVSSINMGKLRLHLEAVDPAELLASSIEGMRPALNDNGNSLVLDVHGGYPSLQADPSRLQQIVWNLVSNAIKFSPRGSEIRVSLRRHGSGVRLSVADQGQGIEPEFLPYLFDRFTQGDVTRNRIHGGLGLGLSIVKHLAQLHGGNVSAQSEGQGRGAVFHVDLPTSNEAAPAQDVDHVPDTGFGDLGDHTPSATADSLRGLNVLVVDDDPEACAMLQLILIDRGATVELANGYEEALRLLHRFKPHVLVSDVGMPGKDGYELLREIRRCEAESGAHLPAVALTSFTRSQDVSEARAAGFDDHLGKPLRPLELIRTIAELSKRMRASTPLHY